MARGRCSAKRRADEGGVADVAVDEGVGGIAGERGEVGGVAGVGELVEIDDGRGAWLGFEPVEDEVGADEAGAAGDEDGRIGGCAQAVTRVFPGCCAGRT